MSSRGAEPHDREPARQPTLAAYAPEPVLPPTASAPDWRSRQGRWVDRSLSGRHHLPCCRGLFRPVAKIQPMHDPPVKKTKTVVSLPAPYPQSLDSPDVMGMG